MIRFSVKYLDGIWRYSNNTMFSKDEERKYAKELCQMFDYFLQKGNILGYSVDVVYKDENCNQQSENIGGNEA